MSALRALLDATTYVPTLMEAISVLVVKDIFLETIHKLAKVSCMYVCVEDACNL